jgi:hypothetical protein
MLLTLQNGYPFPYPTHLTDAEQEVHSEAAGGKRLVLEGVSHFQWLHTVTVEFVDHNAMLTAQKATGWEIWSGLVLEAKTSSEDGYTHPAIVARNMAYCGFILYPEDRVAKTPNTHVPQRITPSVMKRLRSRFTRLSRAKAFLTGLRQFRRSMTPHYADFDLMFSYDCGREWAHRFTLRRYED